MVKYHAHDLIRYLIEVSHSCTLWCGDVSGFEADERALVSHCSHIDHLVVQRPGLLGTCRDLVGCEDRWRLPCSGCHVV